MLPVETFMDLIILYSPCGRVVSKSTSNSFVAFDFNNIANALKYCSLSDEYQTPFFFCSI